MSKAILKGDVVAVLVLGSNVQIWFASPTGDSSDSQIFEMSCQNPEQAEMVAKRHREVWGI